jgi:hypothetical protein
MENLLKAKLVLRYTRNIILIGDLCNTHILHNQQPHYRLYTNQLYKKYLSKKRQIRASKNKRQI